MKMVYHFPRIIGADITIEGTSIPECVQKAIEQRMIQATPTKIQGEIIE